MATLEKARFVMLLCADYAMQTFRKKLFTKSDDELTLDKAKKIALAMEAAAKDMSEIREVTKNIKCEACA